mgnify:CR=1 FL=1
MGYLEKMNLKIEDFKGTMFRDSKDPLGKEIIQNLRTKADFRKVLQLTYKPDSAQDPKYMSPLVGGTVTNTLPPVYTEEIPAKLQNDARNSLSDNFKKLFEVNESLPNKVTDKYKKLKSKPESETGKDFEKHHTYQSGPHMIGKSAEDDTYEIEIKNIDSSSSEEEFLFEMNKTYEEFIKKDPSGYLWMHRRFKSGQVESLYPKWTSRERRREKRRLNRNKD